jgi:PadR family transcriptional regulator, regulatory protein PadR
MGPAGKSRGTFLTLLALEDGAKHGYEVSTYVKERSGGFFSLSFGALYPILHRLEKEGLVKGSWEELGPAKARKVYGLTRQGRAALAVERERHEEHAAALARLLKRGA